MPKIAKLCQYSLKLRRDKKAELSQRRPRDAPYIAYGCPENFQESLSAPTATFPEILMGFCFRPSYECAYKI